MNMDLDPAQAPTCPTAAPASTSAIEGGRIAAVEPHAAAEAAREIDVPRPARVAAVRRRAFPHGRDAVARPAARQPVRHAARRHRAVGRAEAAAHASRRSSSARWPTATGRSRKGLLAIRSHVDVCDPRLLAVEALLEVKRRVAPYLDLQLVAFPQDGYFRSPGAVENLERALDRGVDVVGGIPHFERTMADGAASRARALRDRGRARAAGRHALRRDRRSAVAPHRDAGRRDACGSACRAASPARISRRCTRWTTTMSAS